MSITALNNPEATVRTRSLYRLLESLSGNKILLGQQESPGSGYADREIEWIQAATGETPALRGLDFIHDDYTGVVEHNTLPEGETQ